MSWGKNRCGAESERVVLLERYSLPDGQSVMSSSELRIFETNQDLGSGILLRLCGRKVSGFRRSPNCSFLSQSIHVVIGPGRGACAQHVVENIDCNITCIRLTRRRQTSAHYKNANYKCFERA